MKINPEDLRAGLPAYLTAADQAALVAALRDFSRGQGAAAFYCSAPETGLLQGDVWGGVEVLHFRSGERKRVRALLMSNSCDMSADNTRHLPPKVTVATVIALEAYKKLLLDNGLGAQRVQDHLAQVRAQSVTFLFYLPQGQGLAGEHVAVLQDAHSLPLDAMVTDPPKQRLSSLSQFAFYLFLFKLSVHFCRFLEGVDRGQARQAAP